MHADFAAVNVNFWITPDEANLDPEHGGLVVWDVAAPQDWDCTPYNGAEAASREFLAEAGEKPTTCPIVPTGRHLQFRALLPRNRHDPVQDRLSQPAHQCHAALRQAHLRRLVRPSMTESYKDYDKQVFGRAIPPPGVLLASLSRWAANGA